MVVSGAAFASGKPVPTQAARLVASVHVSAVSQDTKSLRRLMAVDFISSFGGNGGREEALALRRADRRYLERLARATVGGCHYHLPGYLECPQQPGIGYRAGFKRIQGKWVFSSFVAGD